VIRALYKNLPDHVSCFFLLLHSHYFRVAYDFQQKAEGERERERVVREATNGAVTCILQRRVVTTDK
jgi:hypothetical protein